MCGIAGIRRFGKEPIPIDAINTLFLGMQHRGMDAAGLAIENGGQVAVFKDDDPAWEFIAQDNYDKFIEKYLTPDTNTVIIHTRAATMSHFGDDGNPRYNKNNHPLFKGDSAVVHNGMITNHISLFGEFNIERSADTDSDIIRGILDEWGFTPKAIRQLNRMQGYAAIAAISAKHPGELLLTKSGSPLVLAADENFLYWASEKQAIHAAARPWKKLHGIDMQCTKTDLAWRPFPEDSAMLFGPDGFKWHQKFETCTHYKAPNYARQLAEYTERNTSFNLKAEVKKALTPVTEIVEKDIPKHEIADILSNPEGPEEAQSFIQCEHCSQWNYTLLAHEEFTLNEVICGHCGEFVRKEIQGE